METVFDHNITKEEWNFICGLDKEKYLSVVDEESSKIHLAALSIIAEIGEKQNVILKAYHPSS